MAQGVECPGESREEMRTRAYDKFTTAPPVDTVDVDGKLMTRTEWKMFMDACPHEHWTHPEVYLLDGSRMSICNRCKLIQLEPIAREIEETF